MQELASRIKTITLKVNSLLEENKKLQQAVHDKEQLIKALEGDNHDLKASLDTMSQDITALKTANAMLGSDEYKTKTKLKINALVKDIEQCIAQLA